MSRFLHLLFVSLLVVLLPLRGWAGDVMVIEMTTKTAPNSATTNVANLATSSANQEETIRLASLMPKPSDCAMHSQPTTDVVADDAVAHCSSCDTCELCLAVTNVAQVQWLASYAMQHSSPPAFDVSFSSAVNTSDLKPPIS